MTASTETAQRRLLEALAAVDRIPWGLAGLRLGAQNAIENAEASDSLGAGRYAHFWRALDELIEAVETDLHPEEVKA